MELNLARRRRRHTHLVPGLLVAVLGIGMVNPPLASTAVGIVSPARPGMADDVC